MAVLEDGDQIAIDLAAHKLDHLVEESEIAERWKTYVPPQAHVTRGYLKFYQDHVSPASEVAVMPRFS